MSPSSSSDPAHWLTTDEVAVDFGRAPTGAPGGRTALAATPLLVLVGLTGAGKSATVEALVRLGAVRAVLPDRRALTDRIILPAMTGDPDRRVADRIERFRLTAAFRERHPGGMGAVLAHLSIESALASRIGTGWIVFDGVRGAAEVEAAARLPQTVFAALQAPPEIRVARLSLRGDPFDRAALTEAGGPPETGPVDDDYVRVLMEQGLEDLIGPSALRRLSRLLAGAGAEVAAVAAAASIVVEESRHYDPADALAVLRERVPGRLVVVDTAENGVDDVVTQIVAELVQPRAAS